MTLTFVDVIALHEGQWFHSDGHQAEEWRRATRIVESVLMAGAFEEGRLREALNDVQRLSDNFSSPDCEYIWMAANHALATPTLEEGER